MEATLALIKPDAVINRHIGDIIKVIEQNKISITAMKMVRFSPFQAAQLYGVHRDKPFFEDLVKFTTSGPVVAMVLVGENVIQQWRDLMGATNSAEADPDSIRGRFGNKEVIRSNAVHGSDSLQSASFEIRFLFNIFEL